MAFFCPLSKTITLRITAFHPFCNLNLATGQVVGYKHVFILSHIFSLKSSMSSSFTIFLISLSFHSQGSILPSSCPLCSSVDSQSANCWLNAVSVLWPWHWRWTGAGQHGCSESFLGIVTGYRLTRKSQIDRKQRLACLILSCRPSTVTPNINTLFVNKNTFYCYVAYFFLVNGYLL